jgi:hypothetical protein
VSNPYQQDPYTPGPYGAPQQGGYGQPAAPQYGYPQQPGYQTPPPQYAQQQPQPQPPYYPQPGVPGYLTGEPNQLATAAVAMGFISVLGICMYGFGGFLGVVGVGLGIAALNKAKTTGTGRNQAIGGIVLSALGILIGIAVVVAVAVASKTS